MYKNAPAIANQKAALSQLAVCIASSVARPKNSRNIVKFVPNLIFLILASISFEPQRYQWIDLRRTPCRDVTRQSRYDQQENRNPNKRHRVNCGYAVKRAR